MYTSFRIYPEKRYLNQVNVGFNAGMRYGYFGETMLDQWTRVNLHFRFTEFSQMNIYFQSNMERYEGVDYNKAYFSLNAKPDQNYYLSSRRENA